MRSERKKTEAFPIGRRTSIHQWDAMPSAEQLTFDLLLGRTRHEARMEASDVDLLASLRMEIAYVNSSLRIEINDR